MTIRKVWRDASGAIVNIGDWEIGPALTAETVEIRSYRSWGRKVEYEETVVAPVLDAAGNTVHPNPIPTGVYEDTADIVEGPDGGLYEASAVAAMAIGAVKAEAERRILAIMPEHKQRNALAMGMEAVQIYGPDPAAWPAELQAMNQQVQAAWAAIKAIRVRSNEIEAMIPVPADFADDSYWPNETSTEKRAQ